MDMDDIRSTSDQLVSFIDGGGERVDRKGHLVDVYIYSRKIRNAGGRITYSTWRRDPDPSPRSQIPFRSDTITQ